MPMKMVKDLEHLLYEKMLNGDYGSKLKKLDLDQTEINSFP